MPPLQHDRGSHIIEAWVECFSKEAPEPESAALGAPTVTALPVSRASHESAWCHPFLWTWHVLLPWPPSQLRRTSTRRLHSPRQQTSAQDLGASRHGRCSAIKLSVPAAALASAAGIIVAATAAAAAAATAVGPEGSCGPGVAGGPAAASQCCRCWGTLSVPRLSPAAVPETVAASAEAWW